MQICSYNFLLNRIVYLKQILYNRIILGSVPALKAMIPDVAALSKLIIYRYFRYRRQNFVFQDSHTAVSAGSGPESPGLPVDQKI